MNQVLSIKNLKVGFAKRQQIVFPVNGVDLAIGEGETLALVGESGCGKSITAMSAMGLMQSWNNSARAVIEGAITFTRANGEAVPLHQLDDEQFDRIRGNEIGMVFQEPMTSLNPVLTIGYQLSEVILAHERLSKKEALRRAAALLEQVGIPDAANRLRAYPHQFSGGQRQRIVIAMAIACRPRLLIADEPTTALDVTIQAQVLSLLQQLQREQGIAIWIITHNLSVVAQFAHRVAVMYAGYIVESGSVEQIFTRPQHPYTRLLLRSIPSLESVPGQRLASISGHVPDPANRPAGCPFAPRCPVSGPDCSLQQPELEERGQGQLVACPVTREEGVLHAAAR